MIKLTTLLSIICFASQAQYDSKSNYFENQDTSSLEYIKLVIKDKNIWQVGKPVKNKFNSAYSAPNAIITDSLNPYPVNATASFSFHAKPQENAYTPSTIFAVQWMQKIDLEKGKDIAIIEYSYDDGITWHSPFDSPDTYNFYGFQQNTVDTINSERGFSGTDSAWTNIWLCHDISYLTACDDFVPCIDSLTYRFTIKTDGNQTNQDGWMIDNLKTHVTFVHTVTNLDPNQLTINVFPSLTTGKVNIKHLQTEESKYINYINIRNDQGQLLQSLKGVPSKYFVDLSSYVNGTYYIQVITNTESKTVPVVLQK